MSTDVDQRMGRPEGAQTGRPEGAQTEHLRRAFAAVPPSAVPRADCPPAGRIWEGVRGALAPAEFRRIIHHVAGCALCTEAWRLAQKLEHRAGDSREDSSEETPGPPAAPGSGWWRRPGAAAAAAAAVVVLAVGLNLRQAGDVTPAATFRAAGGGEIELLSPGPLPREDCVLRWRGPESADYYQLRVVSAADPLIPLVEETRLEAVAYRVPEDALAGLPPGAELLVHLKAIDPASGRHSTTATVVVR